MSKEDLASLIVTDPDIVDEGIDVSGLRTTTDTNPLLLGNLEPGIKFDPTQQSVYSDLLSYFSGGLPIIETPTASNVNIPLPGGDDSGGGGSVSTTVRKPGDTITTIPIDPGTFTAESLDQSFAGEEGPIVTQPGREAPITVQDMGDGRTTTIPGRPKIMDQPGVTTLSSPQIPQGFEGYYGSNQTVTAEDTPESFIQKIKGFAKGALDNVDIGKAIAMTALNAAVGKPISLAFNILAKLLPEENPINKFNNEYAVGGNFYEDIIQDSTDPQGLEKRLVDYSDSLRAGNIPNQDPFGKNTTSGFGDYTKMATEIATEKLNKIRSGESLSQFEKDQLEYYGRVSGLTGKTNIPGTPLMVGSGEKTSQDLINEARQDYFSSIDTGVDDFTTAITPVEDFGEITTVPTGPTLGESFPGMGGIRTTGPMLGESFPGIGVGYETVDDLDKIKGQEAFFKTKTQKALEQSDVGTGVGQPKQEEGSGVSIQAEEAITSFYNTFKDVLNQTPTAEELKNLIDTDDDVQVKPSLEQIQSIINTLEQESFLGPGGLPLTADLTGGSGIVDTPDIEDTPILDIPDDAGIPEAPAPDRGPPTGISGPPSIISSPPSLDIPDRGRGTIAPSPPPRDDDAGMPEAPTPSPGFTAPTKPGQSPRGGGGGGGGGGGCFLKDTPITMADGSSKKVQKVDLGDDVAEGGKVFATGKFLVKNLHDYKGIRVSGSHMVNEDGHWVRVEDSKYGKSLGDEEYTVYVFGSENRRILINDILFTDYFETTEQQKLISNEKDFFSNWKTYENKIDKDNINILNAS